MMTFHPFHPKHSLSFALFIGSLFHSIRSFGFDIVSPSLVIPLVMEERGGEGKGGCEELNLA